MDKELISYAAAIKDNVKKVIIGKESVIDLILTALIAESHVLLEDMPGTGKTMMAKSLSKSIGATFSRIQFTPDLLPSDLTGLNYFNQKQSEFVFRQGPIFCNIMLADEINRATPRTQSSLLECMEEKQVTVDGETRKLERPFFVIATQNPIETSGTFPLPEAQLDRFLMKINMGTPTFDEEIAILKRFNSENPINTLESVCTKEKLTALQDEYKKVYISDSILKYIVDIVSASRKSNLVSVGVSPRGTIAMMNASRAYAMINGRDYVVPDDIKTLCIPVFAHRLVVRGLFDATATNETIISDILSSVDVPTEKWDR